MGNNYSSYITAYIERNRQEQVALKAHRDKIMKEIQNIALFLVQQYHVTRVILFGSFAKGQHRFDSDVDIAVEGLSSRDYWKAWVEVDNLSSVSVDLRCLEDFPTEFRNQIFKQGILVYEDKRTNCNTHC
jgi:predicted nucleotidyltransferase